MPRQWQVWRSPSRLNEDFSVLQLRQDPRNPRHNGSKPNEGSHCVRAASHTDNMQHSCTPVLYSTLFPLVPSQQQHLSELCYRWLDVDLSRHWQLNDTCCTDCTFGFFVFAALGSNLLNGTKVNHWYHTTGQTTLWRLFDFLRWVTVVTFLALSLSSGVKMYKLCKCRIYCTVSLLSPVVFIFCFLRTWLLDTVHLLQIVFCLSATSFFPPLVQFH